MFQLSRLSLTAAATLFAIAGPVMAQWPAPTDFGSVAVGGTSQQTVTFANVPAGTSFSLYTGTDFSIAPAVCTGGTCQVVVTFSPKYAGLREGAITASTSAGLSAVAFLHGIGTAPQIAIGPGTISTAVSKASSLLSSATLSGMVVADQYILVADTAGNEVFSVKLANGAVTVFAGNGTAGYAGDSGSAASAQLNAPSALAMDALGDVYIADTGNHVVRKVDAFTNVITTVAGNGSAGNTGDGGSAVSAELNAPVGLAVDAVGNLFISDKTNNRVREVMATNGQINGGNQIVNFAGSAAGTAGSAGDSGAATSAQLNAPMGIALDSNGNLYIADSGNQTVREVSGGVIVTVAGTVGSAGYSGDGSAATSAQLNTPSGVAADAAGIFYIADSGNQVVREVSAGTISTFAGTGGGAGYSGDGGNATTATLHTPTNVSVDEAGNVYVLDSGNDAVREITATAAALTFPPTSVGNTSGPLTLIVSNVGNANLAVSAAAITGSVYAQSGGSCGTSGTTTLAAGASCTIQLSFTPATGVSDTGSVAIASNSLNQVAASQTVGLSEAAGLHFVPITPCRIIDTRNGDSFSGSFIAGGTSRDYTIAGSADTNVNSTNCPGVTIPTTALAYSMNVTVVPHHTLSFLTVYPKGTSRPNVSTLNSYDGRIKSTAAIVGADSSGAVSFFATDDTELVIDVDGYFVSSADSGYGTDLEYYPVSPCRVADTRSTNGALGGPQLGVHGERDFPILQSPCAANIPTTVKAYSINIAAVPANGQPLIYLTAWPAGSSQPVASALNAVTGAITSNAVIVPAGSDTSRSVSIYASNATDVVIDINGYFAPPGTGGLSLYPMTPCRVLDTRNPTGSPAFTGTIVTDVLNGTACTLPSVAQAYVLGATVVPKSSLAYLTLWSQGQAVPLESTLNADDQAVTSNLAIVPTNGSVSAYASSSTYLILDIFGYFAP